MTAEKTQEWSIQLPVDPMDILDQVSDHTGAALLVDPHARTLVIREMYGRQPQDGMPLNIRDGRILRHWLPEDIDVRQAKEYLATPDAQALLTRVAAGYSELRNSHGNLCGILDLDASLALDLLQEMLDTMRLSDVEDGAGRMSADAWLEGAHYQEEDGSYRIDGYDEPMVITPETSDDQLRAWAEEIEQDARQYFASVRGVFEYLQDLRLDSETD